MCVVVFFGFFLGGGGGVEVGVYICVGACMHGLELIVTCMLCLHKIIANNVRILCISILNSFVCLSFRLCCTLQYELNFKYRNSCSIRKQTRYCPTPNREVTFSF